MQDCLKEGFALNGPTVGRTIFLVLVLISVLGETILRSVHWGLIQDQGERTCGRGEWIREVPSDGGERRVRRGGVRQGMRQEHSEREGRGERWKKGTAKAESRSWC